MQTLTPTPAQFQYAVPNWRIFRLCTGALATLALTACATPWAPLHPHTPAGVSSPAQLTPVTPSGLDLTKLPPPRTKIVAAVYSFRDVTGQYKSTPNSAFSTAVTQGGASMLVKALKSSGWYIPVEREGLQSLLTERRVLRAVAESDAKQRKPTLGIENLVPASIVLEGGVIGYDSNILTGGLGATFLGIGLTTQYSVDQVTVNLRAVSVQTGEVLDSVSTTKTIYSYELHPSYFRFVNFTDLLQAEGGYTRNEPAQLAVKEAIDAAVMSLTIQGISNHQWQLKDPSDWNSAVIQRYLTNEKDQTVLTPISLTSTDAQAEAADTTQRKNWDFESEGNQSNVSGSK
ncbi:curli production assembly/transport protein CsgG [Alcaligenaceae bacterium]|nr:curli production assembly/transport protein CsgG [Alcaligenaceae bacterium]